MVKKCILFVCTQNSARSQMAEFLMKNAASDQYDVFSAGMQPTEVDVRAKQAIEQFGLHSERLDFDFVILLCEKVSIECEPLNLGQQFFAWNFEGPKTRNDPNPFCMTFKGINERIRMFLLGSEKESKND